MKSYVRHCYVCSLCGCSRITRDWNYCNECGNELIWESETSSNIHLGSDSGNPEGNKPVYPKNNDEKMNDHRNNRRFKRGDEVKVVSGEYKGVKGMINSFDIMGFAVVQPSWGDWLFKGQDIYYFVDNSDLKKIVNNGVLQRLLKKLCEAGSSSKANLGGKE